MGIITQEQRLVCRQHTRREVARVSILNKQNIEIAQIQGKVIEGSINITNESYLRRSATLKLKLDSTLLPNKLSLIWTSNKCKIQIGIINNLTEEIVWFDCGIYLYKTAQINYSATENSLSLSLLDKMANFSGDINGQIKTDIRISNQGTPISAAIRSLATEIGNEDLNNTLIEEFTDDSTGNILTLPYTVNAKAGDKILDIIKTLTELYKYHTCYYNTDGIFVAERTKTLLSDAISEDFRDIDFTITSQVTNDYSYIKNYVKVLGITVQPMVAVQDKASTENPTPINGTTSLRITFNKPLYDSNWNRIPDKADVTNYFQYSGTSGNYTKAVYDGSLWQITFTITGENGKILSVKPNMIFDSTQLPIAYCSFVFSSKDNYWTPLLEGTVITDGINNTIQFKLDFNKPLYNQSGTAISTGSSMKSSFTYADGSGNSNNFLDAIYTIDSTDYYILLTFANPITGMIIEINKNGVTDSNSVYDSAGLIYQPTIYTMDGNTWTLVENPDSLLTYQITAEVSNTDNISDYSIDNIGEIRILVVNDQNIYTKSQATNRANYELQIHSNLNEQINLTCLNLYYLDVNQILQLSNDSLQINGKYRIDKISYDLKSGTSSLTCVKLYM